MSRDARSHSWIFDRKRLYLHSHSAPAPADLPGARLSLVRSDGATLGLNHEPRVLGGGVRVSSRKTENSCRTRAAFKAPKHPPKKAKKKTEDDLLVFLEQTGCYLRTVCSLILRVIRAAWDWAESLRWPVALADGSISFTEIVRISRSLHEIFMADPRDQ